MKSVLISIHPKWCELIASGKKTIEVRKTAPKQVPFKAYIYETFDKKYVDIGVCWGNGKCFEHGCKKVIGEFVCHNISEFESELWDDETHESIARVVHTEDWDGYPDTESYYVAEDGEDNYLCRQSFLTWEDLRSYVGHGFNTFFGWHISDLKIYDKPRELSEFGRGCDAEHINEIHCRDCKKLVSFDDCCEVMCKPLNRPPRSWCYVEELL